MPVGTRAGCTNVQQPAAHAKRPMPPRYRALAELQPLTRTIATNVSPTNTVVTV